MKKKTATQALRAWERREKRRTITMGNKVIELPRLRKVYFGQGLVAMANGDRSVQAIGADNEEAARKVVKLWKAQA